MSSSVCRQAAVRTALRLPWIKTLLGAENAPLPSDQPVAGGNQSFRADALGCRSLSGCGSTVSQNGITPNQQPRLRNRNNTDNSQMLLRKNLWCHNAGITMGWWGGHFLYAMDLSSRLHNASKECHCVALSHATVHSSNCPKSQLHATLCVAH